MGRPKGSKNKVKPLYPRVSRFRGKPMNGMIGTFYPESAGKKRVKTGGRVKGSRGKNLPERTRCICGRNLLFARRCSEKTITCRCGRIHRKEEVLRK